MIIPKLIQNCRECKTCKVMVQTQTPSYRHNLVSTCSLFSSKREQKLTHSFSYCWFILESHKKKVGKKKNKQTKRNFTLYKPITFLYHLASWLVQQKIHFQTTGYPFHLHSFQTFQSSVYNRIHKYMSLLWKNRQWNLGQNLVNDAIVDSCKFSDLGCLNLVSKIEVKFH